MALTYLDSLQATWIYRQISVALRGSGVTHKDPEQNCVYKAPTIRLLSAYILSLVDVEGGTAPAHETQAQDRRLRELLQHYTQDFPSRPLNLRDRAPGHDSVLVTGTTGGLGANILRHLLEDPSVEIVYAFNRPSSNIDAQRETFDRYGLDVALLRSPKMKFVCGDLTQPFFGLDESLFKEVRRFA